MRRFTKMLRSAQKARQHAFDHICKSRKSDAADAYTAERRIEIQLRETKTGSMKLPTKFPK